MTIQKDKSSKEGVLFFRDRAPHLGAGSEAWTPVKAPRSKALRDKGRYIYDSKAMERAITAMQLAGLEFEAQK